MTSKTSYNNIGQYMMQQLRATRSFILLLGVVYLTIGPVILAFQMSTLHSHVNPIPLLNTLFSGYYMAYFFAAIGLGTLGALYITRYQNVQTQSNFYHSLPVSRGRLLTGRIMALVTVQVILLAIVTIAVMVASLLYARSIGESSIIAPLMASAGIHFLQIMLIFVLAMAIALFAGQLTANTVGQILMTVVLHGTVLLLGGATTLFLEPFAETYYSGGLTARLAFFNIFAPVVQYGDVNVGSSINNPLLAETDLSGMLDVSQLFWPLATTLVCVIVAAALLVGTYLLYNRRPVEKAGDTLIFVWVGSVVKAIYVFCGSIFGGFAFYSMTSHSIVAFAVGALIAAVIVHIVAEMIYSQDVNGIRQHFVSTIAPLGVTLVVVALFHSGVVSYDNHLPKASSVQAASISLSNVSNDGQGLRTEVTKDPAMIEKVMAAMAIANEHRLSNEEMLSDVVEYRGKKEGKVQSVLISYKTLIGGETTRVYNIPMEESAKIMASFIDEPAYYESMWSSIADATVESISEFSLSSNGFESFASNADTLWLIENLGATDQENMSQKERETRLERTEALLKAIQADLPNRNAAVLESRPLGVITYSAPTVDRNGKTELTWGIRYTLYEGDTHTNALIKEWREAGILKDERTELLESLDGMSIKTVTYKNGDHTVTGSMTNEEFVDKWLAGELIYCDQADRYGFSADRKTGLIVTDAASDEVIATTQDTSLPEVTPGVTSTAVDIANTEIVSFASFYFTK